MNIQQFITNIDSASQWSPPIPGMTTPRILGVLNAAVRALSDDEIYCEVGSYRGLTLVGALANTGRHGVAIDDFSQFNEDGKGAETVTANIHTFGISATLVQLDYRQALSHLTDVVGVYFYDGSHTQEDTLQGLELMVPHLADHAAVFVDDYSFQRVQAGVAEWIGMHPNHVKILLGFPCFTHPDADWWNGLICLEWYA